MAQTATCKICLFRWSSFGDGAICTECLSRYVMRHAEYTRFGPSSRIGEHLELELTDTAERIVPESGKRRWRHAIHTCLDEPQPTGVFLVTRAAEEVRVGDYRIQPVLYPIDEIACPRCSEYTLVAGLEKDALCPECRKGPLTVSVIFV